MTKAELNRQIIGQRAEINDKTAQIEKLEQDLADSRFLVAQTGIVLSGYHRIIINLAHGKDSIAK
jgi:hypothetical protein